MKVEACFSEVTMRQWVRGLIPDGFACFSSWVFASLFSLRNLVVLLNVAVVSMPALGGRTTFNR